jgi:hypothetical protein
MVAVLLALIPTVSFAQDELRFRSSLGASFNLQSPKEKSYTIAKMGGVVPVAEIVAGKWRLAVNGQDEKDTVPIETVNVDLAKLAKDHPGAVIEISGRVVQKNKTFTRTVNEQRMGIRLVTKQVTETRDDGTVVIRNVTEQVPYTYVVVVPVTETRRMDVRFPVLRIRVGDKITALDGYVSE